MATAVTLPTFNDLVADAITTYNHILPEQLIVLDNSTKYCPGAIQKNESDGKSLSAIFGTMANLNQAALETPNLCAGEYGPSFRDALFLAAGELVMLANGRPVRYVELGPEPWKSRAILTGMLAAKVQLRQYVGVDINPESEETMRKALVHIIGADRFTYCIQDFYKASVADFTKPAAVTGAQDDCVTIITNLGFQEGNGLPSRIGPMLSRLTRPGDLLLSEMQVFHGETGGVKKAEPDPIRHFYLLPEMRRFSALVAQMFESNNTSELNSASDPEQNEYLFNLVPLHTEVGSVHVATTLASVRINGVKKYVLTNSCLKYTSDQFRRVREVSGDFVVKALQETGDKSVIFQISERH